MLVRCFSLVVMYPSIISRNDLQIPSWWKMVFGLLRKRKQNQVIYLKLQNEPFHFKFIMFISLHLEAYRISSSLSRKEKKERNFPGTKAETLAETSPGFFAVVCLLVLFCLANLSLKHSNGFPFLLSNH